ncbi:MAG: hypothetical protein KAU41_11985 [Deltaproteobacteria bacterium]|nr:hypothetical protein [Deltaproteobacteria bacterium]
MKRIGLIIAGISLSLLLLGTGVWADITITDGTLPGVTYETSPNVVMAYADNATGDKFFIKSVNSKGTMEYGILSTYSGYYMHDVGVGNNATTALADPPADNTYSGWEEAGG